MADRTIKGGNVTLKSVNTPSQSVVPGGNVNVEVVIENGAGFIGELDPDACINPANSCGHGIIGGGYCIQTRGAFASQERTSINCIEGGAVGARAYSVDLSFTAPQIESESETFAIDVDLTATGSGQQTDTVSKQITVAESGGSNPPPDDDPDREDDEQNMVRLVVLGIGGLVALKGIQFIDDE